MTVKQYRCVVTALTIRTQPRLGDQFKTQQQLKQNDVISADDSTQTEADGFVWLQFDRGWSAQRSLDGKTIFLFDASIKPRDRLWGINIDPYNPGGNPTPTKLAGIGWVRFVFQASSKRQTLEQAFAYYDPIIQNYAHLGVKVLLIIIQDTYSGNAPWSGGNWDTYIQGYADTVGKIARHYRGQVAAYEIWNEMDVSGQPTSISIAPQTYGALLLAAAEAVKLGDPGTAVISGGLVSSDPVGYMTKVRDSLGGNLPIDGIGFHPYGQTPPNTPVFPNYSRGALGTGISKLVDAFPGIPIWITEIGVPRVDVNNAALWPPIANYLLKTFQYIHSQYFHVMPVLIWFAWTDSMDNAGIVHDNQQPKGPIFDAFFQNLRADVPVYVKVADTPYAGGVLLTHLAGQLVAEQSIAELAKRVATSACNVRGLLVTSGVGTSWEGQTDSKKSLAVTGPADLGNWATELAKYCIKLHAWHDLVGQNASTEIALIAQAAQAPGVASIVLDLDATRLALRNSGDIRTFMIALRQALPQHTHIGVSFDGRLDHFQAINLPEWYPFIDSWHPKVFHWTFSNGQDGPSAYIGAAFQGLQPYPKPVIPMLQAEPAAGKPVPPEQMKLAANLSLVNYGAPGVSYSRLGAIGPAEFAAIQSIQVPYLAGYAPAPKSADVLTVQTTSALRIRSAPSLTASVVGLLQPGEQITVLERTVVGPLLFVRHSRGWSLAKNGQTGEIFLA